MKATKRYQDLKLLGKGGMGEVYRAHDTEKKHSVALKVVRTDRLKETKIIKRFEREFESLVHISHPNVIKIFDVGRFDDRSYYSMEYVEGQSIEELLEDGPLEAKRAVQLAIDVCDGLAAVHELGLCHRDITPSNIMVTRDGIAKVMDFGLVKPVEETVTQLTETGHIVGTFVYLPPELLLGRPGDYRSDIYQVAVTLYQMLMGKPPFEPEQVLMVARGRKLPEPKPFCGLSENADARLAAILWKAMSFNPAKRYVSAAALRDALKHWLVGDFRSDCLVLDEEGRSFPKLPILLLVVLMILAFAYWRRPTDVDYEVQKLSLDAKGAKTVVVSWLASWRTERPEIVLHKVGQQQKLGAIGRTSITPEGEAYRYHAVVGGLAPEQRYELVVKKPDGSSSLGFEFNTMKTIKFAQDISYKMDKEANLTTVIASNTPFLLEARERPKSLEPHLSFRPWGFHRRWAITYALEQLGKEEISVRCMSIDGEKLDLAIDGAKALKAQCKRIWRTFSSNHEQRKFHRLFSKDNSRANPLFHEWAIQLAKGEKKDGAQFWKFVEERLSKNTRWFRSLKDISSGILLLGEDSSLSLKLGDSLNRAFLPLELVDGAAVWFGLPRNEEWQKLFACKPYFVRRGVRPLRSSDLELELQWQKKEKPPWTIIVDGFHPTAKTFVPPSAREWCEPQKFVAWLGETDVKQYREAELLLSFRSVYAGMVTVVDLNNEFLATFPPTDNDVQSVQDFINRTGAHTKMGLMMLNDPFSSPGGTAEAVSGMDALMPKAEMVYRHSLPLSVLADKKITASVRVIVGPVDEVRPLALCSLKLRLYR